MGVGGGGVVQGGGGRGVQGVDPLPFRKTSGPSKCRYIL